MAAWQRGCCCCERLLLRRLPSRRRPSPPLSSGNRRAARPPRRPASDNEAAAGGGRLYARWLLGLESRPLAEYQLLEAAARRRAATAYCGGAVGSGLVLLAAAAGVGDWRRRRLESDASCDLANATGNSKLSLALACCLSAAAAGVGCLWRRRRVSRRSAETLCRLLLDRPGRSWQLAAPSLSAFSWFSPAEFLVAWLPLSLLLSAGCNVWPEEKLAVFLSANWTAAAARCLWQLRPSLSSSSAAAAAAAGGRSCSFYHGPFGGLCSLAALSCLAVRERLLAADGDGDGDGDGDDGDGVSQTMRDEMRRLRPDALLLIPSLWAVGELLALLLTSATATATATISFKVRPQLYHVTNLAGLAHGALYFYCLRPLMRRHSQRQQQQQQQQQQRPSQ